MKTVCARLWQAEAVEDGRLVGAERAAFERDLAARSAEAEKRILQAKISALKDVNEVASETASEIVRSLIGTRQDIAALVLGAAPAGNPGPMVANFTGTDAGKLPCPVMIIPGGLSKEDLERLS